MHGTADTAVVAPWYSPQGEINHGKCDGSRKAPSVGQPRIMVLTHMRSFLLLYSRNALVTSSDALVTSNVPMDPIFTVLESWTITASGTAGRSLPDRRSVSLGRWRVVSRDWNSHSRLEQSQQLRSTLFYVQPVYCKAANAPRFLTNHSRPSAERGASRPDGGGLRSAAGACLGSVRSAALTQRFEGTRLQQLFFTGWEANNT